MKAVLVAILFAYLSNLSIQNECNCLLYGYWPECGFDGRTYFNQCHRLCHDVKNNYNGICRGCDCPWIIQPVCGEDGFTYVNSCEARCLGKIVVHGDICGQNCDCEDFGYNPICGSDGKTYSNTCEAKCKMVQWNYNGPCELRGLECDHCSLEWKDPVCDIQGKVYQNACFARCTHAQIDPYGKCLGGKADSRAKFWHFS